MHQNSFFSGEQETFYENPTSWHNGNSNASIQSKIDPSKPYPNSNRSNASKETFTSSSTWLNKKSSIWSMEKEWKTYSSIGVQRRILEKNTEIIKEFINSLGMPGWYRGVSIFQKKSAELLLSAIRDDRDQHTLHRTRRCLESLGLDPLPTAKQLQKLLHLCGGSDLAFLWFLWEWIYQDSETESYSVNEQLILTSIAHLDMNTTLRELDRILPPAQIRKKVMRRKSDAKEEELETSTKNPCNCKKSDHNLPYFQKIPEPIQRRTSYIGIERNRQAILGRYQYQYKDPNYEIPNETGRWFKGYKIDSRKKVEGCILNEEMSGIYDNFNAAMLDVDKVTVLCKHHEEIEELKNSFDDELRDFLEKKSQAMGERFQKRRPNYNHLIERLHHDIEKYRQEFHLMAENYRKHFILKLLSLGLQRSCSSDNKITQILKSSSDDKTEFTTIISCGAYDDKDKPHKPTLECGCVVAKILQHDKAASGAIETTLPKMETLLDCNSSSRSHKTGEHNMQCGCIVGQADCCSTHCSCYHGNQKEEDEGEVEMAKDLNIFKRKTSLMDFQEKYLMENKRFNSTTSVYKPKNFGQQETKYFEAGGDYNQVYKFDYRKIFEFKDNNKEIMKMKADFVEAVDSDIALLNQLQKEAQNREVLENTFETLSDKICHPQVEKPQEETRVVDYKVSYYDPNDDDLMDRLLQDALSIMKKDKKFVFASLPAAHRFSFLREWIRLRFGKTYSREELTTSFQESLPIFKALAKVGLSVKLPSNEDMGTDLITDYSCRDYVLKKSNSIRQEFYKRIDKALLAQSRVIYFAMRPFLCSNGPPRNTIFAYMPAHRRENYYFRPWKPEETMRTKQVNYFQPWKSKKGFRSGGKRKVADAKAEKKNVK